MQGARITRLENGRLLGEKIPVYPLRTGEIPIGADKGLVRQIVGVRAQGSGVENVGLFLRDTESPIGIADSAHFFVVTRPPVSVYARKIDEWAKIGIYA